MDNETPKIESIELPLPEFPKKPGKDILNNTEIVIPVYVDRFDANWRAYANELHRVANEEIVRIKNELAIVRTDAAATIMKLTAELKTSNEAERKTHNDINAAKGILWQAQAALKEADAAISKVLVSFEPVVTFTRVGPVDGGGS